jgi:hypothetical protein
MLLADMGADLLRVDRLQQVDPDKPADKFEVMSRGRRSMMLNLKAPVDALRVPQQRRLRILLGLDERPDEGLVGVADQMQVVPVEEGGDLGAESQAQVLTERDKIPVAALLCLQLPQRFLALERMTGIGALRRHRLVEHQACQRRDLFVGKLVRRPADDIAAPGALQPQVLLLTAQEGIVVVGGAERDLDFGAVAEEGAAFLGNAPTKPELSAPWVLPRFEHFSTHVASTFVYHRAFAKALFCRSKLSLLGFSERLAEGEELGSNLLRMARSSR